MINKSSVNVARHVHGNETLVRGDEYFADLEKRIQDVIGLMETVCYIYEGGKPKSEWNEYALSKFNTFRKQVLDLAEEVCGICDNMTLRDDGTSRPRLFRWG